MLLIAKIHTEYSTANQRKDGNVAGDISGLNSREKSCPLYIQDGSAGGLSVLISIHIGNLKD
jgi:hypothetical protein